MVVLVKVAQDDRLEGLFRVVVRKCHDVSLLRARERTLSIVCVCERGFRFALFFVASESPF